MEMVVTLHGLALFFYIAAAGVLIGSLVEGRRMAPRIGEAILTAAVLAHGGGLVAYTVGFDELPLVGLAPSLSVLGFLIGVVLLAMGAFREARTLGLILAPFVAIILTIGLVLGVAPSGEPLAFRGPWFFLHVVLAFIGYTGLAVSFAAGLVYLLQFRELKAKHLGRVFRFFPSLDTLDLVGRRALALGFPALTLALALGWAWTVRFRHSFAFGDPKVAWAVMTWFTFVTVMTVRSGGAARERRGALASVVGFAIVVLAYVVLRLATAEGAVFL